MRFTEQQLTEMRELFSMPGWRHLVKIWAERRERLADSVLNATMDYPQTNHFRGQILVLDEILRTEEQVKQAITQA